MKKRHKVFKHATTRVVMARRRKSVRHFGRARKSYRKKSMLGGGLVGDVVAGGVVGAGIAFAGPTINQYIPALGPLTPTTVAILGGGAVAKTVLHKGGKFASAAVIIGSAMAAHDLMAGMGGTDNGGGMPYY